MSIPIQNIYYLLCYAWDKLDEKDAVFVSKENFTTIQDLLARVLINGASRVLKRGLERTYTEITGEIAVVKGKLDFSGSIKRNALSRQRAICTFDEYSADSINNRILSSTIRMLLRTNGLAPQLKQQLRSLIPGFSGVSQINLDQQAFKQIKIHRNNRHYDFPLKVCQLIAENSIPTESPGVYRFIDFEKDETQMNRLFERFVLNFYKREQPEFRVSADYIYWKLVSDNEEDMDLVPSMQTDIVLKNKSRKIIIDAKYYQNTLITHYGKEILHSANLYQITSYLLNQYSSDSVTHSVTGILLYPTVQKELNLNYRYFGYFVKIRTVDLHQDWQVIEQRLKNIIE